MALQNVEANITLDLYNHDTTPSTVKAIQLDSQTRYVAAMLQNGGVQYDVDSGATVQLIVVRPDKVGAQITGTTFTYGDEGAQFLGPYAELTQVALAVNGKMRGQFKITSGTQILRTEIFAISNGEALDASTDEWADEYDGYNLEEMATSIETNTADIASLEADVSQIKEDFNDLINSAYVTDSASGSVAHFTDGADNLPLKSLIVDINPIQDLSNGDPSHENICPISGWTGMKIQHTGKNLLAEPFAFRPMPSTLSDCFFAKAGTYHFSFDSIGTATKWRFGISMFDAQGNALSGNDYKPNSNLNFITSVNMWYFGADGTYKSFSFTLQTDCYIRIWFGSGNTTASMTATNAQLEVGSSATPYSPYTGQSITINLGQTVYGGKLDVLTGILTVYPYYASYNGETLTGRWISDRDVYAVGTTPTIGAQVVNIGAQGTEYQLEPHEVESILGANNIFADTGDVSCEYRADTKLFISRLTEPDADMIADSNITSGKYFMVGNNLYKATANIASGGQVIVGTNCIRKSLSEALNEINA